MQNSAQNSSNRDDFVHMIEGEASHDSICRSVSSCSRNRSQIQVSISTARFLAFVTLFVATAFTTSSAMGEISLGGSQFDDLPSLIYNAESGDLIFEAGGRQATTLEIKSESGLFGKCIQPPGLFDVCSNRKLFWLQPAGFPFLEFEMVLEPDLSPEFLAADLEVAGSFKEGGGFRSSQPNNLTLIDLVVVPEPNGAMFLLTIVSLFHYLRSK